ncbi:MAG: hypothetical protein V2I56_27120 [Desulfobacteraceae bacterium]|jgi:hypothetical protein|nr:hypothetical protein [Desulfobacteraceae bacterium]
MDLEQIEVGGDFPLAEVQTKTKNFEFCLERIDDYFGEETNLSCTVGTFPEKHSPDYCWGGCPGALQEAMHIFRGFYPDVDKKMGKVRYVVGNVKGPLNLADDERVIFMGNCTRWEGKINGESVKIEGSYQNACEVDETKTKHNDMLLKFIATQFHTLRNKSSRYIHVKGCPVSVAQHVNYLAAMAKVSNPNFDSRLVFQVNASYYQMHFKRFANRLFN